MDVRDRAGELREASNPLFNDRKLKLGTFCSNLSGGATMSTIDGTLKVNWESTAALAKLADEMEFEAIVPVGRWKGFGGSTNFNGEGFECFTWAAAMGASTKNPAVFATCHVPTMHPVMAAKQATTIDHVSGGRFTLNIVTGWYRPEIEMFGVSPKGREFAAKHADVNFVNLDAHDFDSVRARVEASRKTAWDECQREIQVWTNAYIFQADTEAEARAFYEYCVFKNGDWEGVENLVNIMGLNSLSIPVPALKNLKEHFIAGWAGYGIVGNKEQVVDKLALLERAGFDGG